MAGSAAADTDGSGVGSALGEGVALGEGGQRARGRGGVSARRAARPGVAGDPRAGGGRAVRVQGLRGYRRRLRAEARRLQDRPHHAHHARNTPPPQPRLHELDQPVAAIYQKFNTKRHHHHQPPVHDREEEAVPRSGPVNAVTPVMHAPHALHASEPTDCPPRY